MTEEQKYENYYGWIPCVGGELLFEHTTPVLAECDVYSLNHPIPKGLSQAPLHGYVSRYIIASSVYDWQDSPEPGARGLFRVVVAGQVENSEIFRGQLHIVPALDKNGRKNVCPNEHELIKKLELLEIASYEALATPLDSREDAGFEPGSPEYRLQEFIGVNESTEVSNNKGCISTIINKIKQTKHAVSVDFRVSSEGFASLHASYLPSGRAPKQEYTACRQAFYYIKYLLHRHSHHDPANDSLTTVHQCEDGFVLAKSLISELKAALIEFKRGDFHNKKEMTGVAVYAKSLLVSCSNITDQSETKPTVPAYYADAQYKYFDNLSASLSLLHNEHVSFWGGWRATLVAAYQVLATFFMLITPFLIVGVKNLAERPASYILGGQNTYISERTGLSFNYVINSVIDGSPAIIAAVYVSVIISSIGLAIIIRKPSSRYRKRENRFLRWLKNTARSQSVADETSKCRQCVRVLVFAINRTLFGIKRQFRRIAQNEKSTTTKVVVSTLVVAGLSSTYLIYKGISTVFAAVFYGLL
tara:strand:+ start:1222 stop:2811 length:1590 start_codon:yes stop_codon:yes gene_type:complete